MCARQMEPQVKTEERPDKASIQLKAAACLLEAARKARKPKAEAKMMAKRGRPLRSM